MARKFPENEDDFIRMQQEAIRRVRDMQERARSTLESAGVPFDNLQSPPPPPPAAPVNPPPPREPHSRPVTQSVWTAPVPAMQPPSPSPESAQRLYTPEYAPPAPIPRPASAARPIAAPRPEPGHAQFHPPVPPLLGNLLPAVHISLDSEQILLMVLMFLLYQDNSDKFLILALAYVLLI